MTGLSDKLVGGWRADYIFTYIFGFPGGAPEYHRQVRQLERLHRSGHGQEDGTKRLSYNPHGFPATLIIQAAPQLNIAIAKTTNFRERYKLQFRAETCGGPNTTFPSARFGQLPEAQLNLPRLVQFVMSFISEGETLAKGAGGESTNWDRHGERYGV